MADNNKFSVDIEVNSDGKASIEQLGSSMDSLRNSLNAITGPFSTLSKNLITLDKDLSKATASLNKLASQNKEFASSSDNSSNKIGEFSSAFQTLIGTFVTLRVVITGWYVALSGGLALFTTFAPEIMNFIGSWIKGKEAINEAKLSLSNLNDALSSTDYSTAVEQVNELKINVGLAKQELIKKKDVVDQYNESLGKTMGTVNTLDEVESKLTKNAGAYIKMTLYKAAAHLALQEAAKKAFEAEQLKISSDEDNLTFWDKTVDFLKHAPSFDHSEGAKRVNAEADSDRKQKAKERRDEAVAEANGQKNTLLKIADQFQKDAAKIANGSGMDLFGGQTTPPPSRSNNARSKAAAPPPPPPPMKMLEIAAQTFSEKVEQDKKNYETEMALLDRQYANKLISQDEYYKKSAELEQKFQLVIGRRIKDLSNKELTELKAHIQDMVTIQQHGQTMADDEKAVKKAILPADKLAAEKKLIEDKYAYEIAQAHGNAEAIKQIEEQKLQALSDLNKRYEEERKAFALQTTQAASDTAFTMLKDSIRSRTDAKLKELNEQKQSELSNTSLTGSQKQAIEAKYKKKEAEEKVKAFKAEQRASILQAVINGALAITKATSQTGVLAAFAIPAIIVSTALQVATIAKQKPPQYAQGGLHYQSDGRGALLSGYSRTDNTNAYLRSGEAVVVSEAMRNPWARNLVSAINVAYGGRDFSTVNPGRGYAIGGVFTDGGNANRYYNQPVTDAKELANTMAYQMINNFPPIYVDVKDVNNQQNILAQTVNRVNL